MIRGKNPIPLKVRRTKCVLRQASKPTMQSGNFRNVATSGSRLIFLRNKTAPLAEPNQMKDLFAVINANRHQLIRISRRQATSPISK